MKSYRDRLIGFVGWTSTFLGGVYLAALMLDVIDAGSVDVLHTLPRLAVALGCLVSGWAILNR